jgi:DNA-binding transcriptional LysR family regulator
VDRFDAMQIFVRVVEKGSFSAVAKERGIGQPAVSKQISALENELGTELIHRTSRSIALTEPGRDFYESALHILDDFEERDFASRQRSNCTERSHSRDGSSHVRPSPHGVKAGCIFCRLPGLSS